MAVWSGRFTVRIIAQFYVRLGASTTGLVRDRAFYGAKHAGGVI